MKIISKMFFVSLTFLLISCDGQNKNNNTKDYKAKNEMAEKFDFEEYKKRESAVHKIKKNDTIIEMMFIENKIGTYNETPPKPSFFKIYKEFYSNGNIKKKETYIGESTKVGISEYYDEDGNVEKVDEDKKFGKIKPIDALKFLETKGILNLKTGEVQQTTSDEDKFGLSFIEEKGHKYFVIVIKEGKSYDGPIGRGEPPAGSSIAYYMDGETGVVTSKK